jgi:2,3-bisphosphoglycerate-independent phosphoglycerate mutase
MLPSNEGPSPQTVSQNGKAPATTSVITMTIPHAWGGTALANSVRELYLEGETDYALDPVILADAQGNPVGRIQDGDAVIFCCRRGEREIQLTEAFTEPGFKQFPRPDFQSLIFVILTLYHDKFKGLPVAFAPREIKDTLSEIVSRARLRQLHVAESEKFAHVTYFFNGGNHQAFAGEEDICVPSPRGVPFEQVPELSLRSVTEQVLCGIARQYDLIVVNFANGDVIGHTSNREAKIKCAEIVDTHLERVIRVARMAGYVTLATADHGNLEEMTNADGTPHVSHTANPVPLLLIDPLLPSSVQVRSGKLADIAPTILDALGIAKPSAMAGETLVPNYNWGDRRKVLLIILDGWGIGKQNDANPIWLAQTPVWGDLTRTYPWATLAAAGDAVGLKPGRAGNSEAGHMNIGAGRVVLQDDVRLDLAMKDGSFYRNETLCRTIHQVKERKVRLHLIGLLTEKSSHGSIDYPLALLRMANANGECTRSARAARAPSGGNRSGADCFRRRSRIRTRPRWRLCQNQACIRCIRLRCRKEDAGVRGLGKSSGCNGSETPTYHTPHNHARRMLGESSQSISVP